MTVRYVMVATPGRGAGKTKVLLNQASGQRFTKVSPGPGGTTVFTEHGADGCPVIDTVATTVRTTKIKRRRAVR